MEIKDNQKIVLLRISTISHSLDLLLKGQLKYVGEHGFDVHISCTEDDRTSAIAEREHAQFHPLPLSRSLSPFADLVSLIKAIRLMRKVKPTIVHTHSPKAGIIGIVAAWICNVPVRIHTIAGLPLTETAGFKKKLLIWVERITYNLSTKVWPNSKMQMQYIFEQGIYKDRNKLEVLGEGGSNGIDLDFFKKDEDLRRMASRFRAEKGIQENDVVLAFVGRLAFYKGVNELVDAFTALQKKYDHLKLLLVGPFEEINPLKYDVLNQIENNRDIISVGHQSDIRSYLVASDIFVFPSYREGFPQSLMQACAMGLPVIATDINGCNEIIKHNERGILISPKDSNEIVSAVTVYLNEPAFRNQMAQNGRDFILKHFEQKRFWDILIAHYREAIRKTEK